MSKFIKEAEFIFDETGQNVTQIIVKWMDNQSGVVTHELVSNDRVQEIQQILADQNRQVLME